MAENPLLPHRKLQELYTLMERCRVLERKHKISPFRREALLAAVAIHLAPGDILSGSANDRTAAQLAPAPRAAVTATERFEPRLPRLPLCAATARGLQTAGAGGTLVALAQARATEPQWSEGLTWAQRERLPLVLICSDAEDVRRSTRAKADTLDWPNLTRLAKRLHLPTITVDGEDAVAMYRVMQEAMLRARTAGGPAVVWAMLSPASAGATAPLRRLQHYMKSREIPLPR